MHVDDRYRHTTAACGIGVWDWDLATGVIDVDPILKELLGYQEHEIRDLDEWRRLVHPDDLTTLIEAANALVANGVGFREHEHRMVHRDGSTRWFVVRGAVTRNARGVAVRLSGTGTDITERKRTEAAVYHGEQIDRWIVENITDCVKILDLDGRLVYLSREGLRFLGIEDVSLVMNRPITEFFEGESRQAAAAVAAARSGGSGRFQGRLRSGAGVERWWDIVVTPITDENGAVVQLLAVSRDITERRRDEAIRAAQHQVLGMIATGSALPDVLDCLVRLVEQQANGMRCSVLMLDEDGTHIRHGAAPSLPDDYVRAVDGITIGPRSGSCGTAMFRGTRVIVTDILADPLWDDYRELGRELGVRACWSTPIFSPQRAVLGSFAMYYDQPRTPTDDELALIEAAADVARIAIEQQRAQQALRHSEARNRAILRAIPDWMFLTTIDGVFLDFHAKDTSRLHVPPSEFLGRRVSEVLPPGVADALVHAFARAKASDEPETLEYMMGTDGSERFYEACIVRCDGDKILSIVRDVSDRKRAAMETDAQRRQLAHLSRIAMLGELTGALAHELSQPLTAVRANAQAARHFLRHDPLDVTELRATVDDIIRNNQRAGAVIDRLRALLRKEEVALQPVDMNDVVREAVELAHSEIQSRRITLTSTLAPEVPPVLGDRVQLQQVVLNLVLNACDAMSEMDRATRHLALATERVDGAVQLVVSDSGPGIAENQLERVFEPFVTSRDQGLGLGLAISRSIVSAHKGSIRAENNGTGGATFRCRFPLADTATLA
jgi:PAS domain S-box-containing protein